MGAEGQIRYDYNTISNAVSSIDSAVNTMRATLQDIETGLKPLEAGGDWESISQQAYFEHKQKWHQASEHIAMLLGQVRGALEAAAERMRAADNKAATYF